MKGDQAYGEMNEISEMPKLVIDRVRHFFLTYKDLDGAAKNVEITHVYGREEAYEVIQKATEDYASKFGNADEALVEAFLGAFVNKLS